MSSNLIISKYLLFLSVCKQTVDKCLKQNIVIIDLVSKCAQK